MIYSLCLSCFFFCLTPWISPTYSLTTVPFLMRSSAKTLYPIFRCNTDSQSRANDRVRCPRSIAVVYLRLGRGIAALDPSTSIHARSAAIFRTLALGNWPFTTFCFTNVLLDFNVISCLSNNRTHLTHRIICTVAIERRLLQTLAFCVNFGISCNVCFLFHRHRPEG
ncbi:hypothetical protein PR003_g8208 [Phytophthora rubi]|uniref:Secreted protein n=1 Tax=Phytophthora rubi TaxID=129364 RepID=A0A6A4FJR1_9STRA|nr:hypothetical protein PR001_g7609 [Phytophthora rubi]KAE9344925.1 hypothetical protein PR003_g8208 [Phytophthora rubi]